MSIATPARKSQTISQEIGESQKLLFKIYYTTTWFRRERLLRSLKQKIK